MKIIKANERSVSIIGNEPILLNSYLTIQDSTLGDIIVEVTDIENYVNNNGEFIYSANCKPLNELEMGIDPKSKIIKTSGSISNKYLLPKKSNHLLALGVIRSTEMLHKELSSEFSNVCNILKDGKIIPQNGVPFLLDISKFRESPHIGIFGGSGSGKTWAFKAILEELMKQRISGIVPDPHNEMDFHLNSDEFSGNYTSAYEIFTIGKDVGIDFEDISTIELIELIQFVGSLSQPMQIALMQIHEKGDSTTYLLQKMSSLQFAFANEDKPAREQQTLPADIAKLYHSLKNKIAGASTLQALSWRIEGLVQQNIFNYGVDGIERALKTRKLCIVRGKNKELNMVISFVIRKMYQKRRKYIEHSGEKMPPFFVVTDEAHIFAPKDSETPTTKLFIELAQESRKYGVFLAFATQRPNLLHPTIMAQLSTKFIFRTVIASDIRLIKAETSLTEDECDRLPFLNSGNAFVSSPICKKSSVKFRALDTVSVNSINPFDELDDFDEGSPLEKQVLEFLPIRDINFKDIIAKINLKYNSNNTIKDLIKTLRDLEKQGIINIQKTPMGNIYK